MSLLFEYVDKPVMLFWAMVASFPLYFWVGNKFFDSWDDFLDALSYLYQPHWLSILRGELQEESNQTVKLFFFSIVCICLFIGVYKFFKWIF